MPTDAAFAFSRPPESRSLRLALAEMLYGEEQKPGVAINEAVELVKKYGAEDDYQFVNGLLGAVARERGETDEPKC